MLYGKNKCYQRRSVRRVAWTAAMLLGVLALPALGQSQYQLSLASIMSPSSASTQMYFAHLTDGAGWATTLVFSNPSQYAEASVNVSFHGDTGQPLLLDFGSGAAATLAFTVPAGGTVTFSSTGAGTTASGGWAYASSSVPLAGSLMYRAIQNGKPVWDVAALATSPTYYYFSYATPQIGVAIANPSTTQTIQITMSCLDTAGKTAASKSLSLTALTHTSFNLGQTFPTLPANFKGSLVLSSADLQPTTFLAYTINVRDGLLAPLPPGELRSPAPADRLLADAHAQAKLAYLFWVQAASSYGDFTDQSTAAVFLRLASNSTVNVTSDSGVVANYRLDSTGVQINVSRQMVEALADSKGALAFMLAHYINRAVIDTAGNPSSVFRTDPSASADLYALITVLTADLGSNGMLDFYGRMKQAMGLGLAVDSSVQTEFVLNGDFVNRMTRVWQDLIRNGCANGGQQSCTVLHDLWHPHFPALIP